MRTGRSPGTSRELASDLRPLPRRFYLDRATEEIARDLLGMVLVHEVPGALVAGTIVEVEAYLGPDDLAAHTARGRRTARVAAMWGIGGHAYVYRIYGLHWCLNVVTRPAGEPQAILLRGVEPLVGIEEMHARRGAHVAIHALARGPGNLARAFGVDGQHYGADLTDGPLRIAAPRRARRPEVIGTAKRSAANARPATRWPVEDRDVVRSPRVGVAYAGPWAEAPLRFSVRGHPCVSVPPRIAAVHARSAGRPRAPGPRVSAAEPCDHNARPAGRRRRSSPK